MAKIKVGIAGCLGRMGQELMKQILEDKNFLFIGGFEHQGYFALIDKDGYIRSRKDNFGNPIMYYLGINDMNASQQGIEMLSYDIKKLIDE